MKKALTIGVLTIIVLFSFLTGCTKPQEQIDTVKYGVLRDEVKRERVLVNLQASLDHVIERNIRFEEVYYRGTFELLELLRQQVHVACSSYDYQYRDATFQLGELFNRGGKFPRKAPFPKNYYSW